MANTKKSEDLSSKIETALKKASEKVISEAKAMNSYIVVSDRKGSVKKIYAREL